MPWPIFNSIRFSTRSNSLSLPRPSSDTQEISTRSPVPASHPVVDAPTPKPKVKDYESAFGQLASSYGFATATAAAADVPASGLKMIPSLAPATVSASKPRKPRHSADESRKHSGDSRSHPLSSAPTFPASMFSLSSSDTLLVHENNPESKDAQPIGGRRKSFLVRRLKFSKS